MAGGAVPGRNRRFLPAWAANEPPARLLNASHPAPTNNIFSRWKSGGGRFVNRLYRPRSRPDVGPSRRRPLRANAYACRNPVTGGAVPGRNRRLLPALATNEPPAHLLNASRPAPTRVTGRYLSFRTSYQTGEKSFPEDKIPHRCAHRFGMTREINRVFCLTLGFVRRAG